jgi:hypothetical protein
MLPKKIAICKQYRKCGKPSCKCNVGALHGPYYFYFYRVNGKLKKSYIRKADAKKLWEIYSLRRDAQKKRAANKREFTKMCKNLRRIDRLLSEPFLLESIGGWI